MYICIDTTTAIATAIATNWNYWWFATKGTASSAWFEVLDWPGQVVIAARFSVVSLPSADLSLAYVREYPPKIWPYMVQYLHFRILKIPIELASLEMTLLFCRWTTSTGLKKWPKPSKKESLSSITRQHCGYGSVLLEGFLVCAHNKINLQVNIAMETTTNLL